MKWTISTLCLRYIISFISSPHRVIPLLCPIRDSIRICVPIRMYIFSLCKFGCNHRIIRETAVRPASIEWAYNVIDQGRELSRPASCSLCTQPTIQRGDNENFDLISGSTATTADEATGAFTFSQQLDRRHTYICSRVGSSATACAGLEGER